MESETDSKLSLRISKPLLNVLLAVAIFYNAELGRLMGIQGLPLPISVVWLATGFSLAALLLLGKRVWPGIFLGNFAYNFLHLFHSGAGWFTPTITAAIIAFGSLAEALCANWIMRRYCTNTYFYDVKDIFIFLVPAGLLSCLIASTLGTAALYVYGSLPIQTAFHTWLTFWIGDAMGVYIFTPLLVVWTLASSFPVWKKGFSKKKVSELFLIVLAFVAVTALNFNLNYPLLYLYLPISLWVSYRFRMRGATLIVFLISLTAIIAFWTFSRQGEPFLLNPLMIMVIFLEVTVATSLLLAALVNERELAVQHFKDYNIDLRHVIEMRNSEMNMMNLEVMFKEKLASRGQLTSYIARQVQLPLQKIVVSSKATKDYLLGLVASFKAIEKKISPEIARKLTADLENLESSLSDMQAFVSEANRVAKVIELQSTLAIPEIIQKKSINVNSLLTQCLKSAMNEASALNPALALRVIEEMDKRVKMVLLVPEDLAHAFFHLLSNAIHSLSQKKNAAAASYIPTLKLITSDLVRDIMVEIHYNGMALDESGRKLFYSSFLSNGREIERVSDMQGLTTMLAHDIITSMYHGELIVESQKDETTKVTILLPKKPKTGV